MKWDHIQAYQERAYLLQLSCHKCTIEYTNSLKQWLIVMSYCNNEVLHSYNGETMAHSDVIL